jgi:periplasmic protein TonB
MAYASALLQVHPAPLVEQPHMGGEAPKPDFPFPSLVVVERPRRGARLGAILGGSLFLHALLIGVVILLPLVLYDAVPEAREGGLRAFFAAPPDIAPPPPPPPPPAPAALARPRAPSVETVRPLDPTLFTAPLQVPDRVVAEPTDLGGVEGGVPGGVEGGVPGGVVGGIVGGLPREGAIAEPPVKVVRVGGQIAAPKLVHTVRPEYPEVARMAHLSGIVVLEALVGIDGRVENVKALNANPVLEQAATDAVAQWRYKPLLLNGVPTRFILTVTITFRVTEPGS